MPHTDPIRPQPASAVDIEFEGRTYRGVLGQSIAGILLANDVLDWRTTSSNQAPRGLFCGIGVCFDCVVTVDGVSPTSAPAKGAPVAVNTLSGNILATFTQSGATDMADVDVLIIGAGPAGLAAATSARRAGATVRVLEASDESGGQFWRHLPATRPAGDEQQLHHQWQRYQQFRSAAAADPALAVDVGAHVWTIERRDDRCASTSCAATSTGPVDAARVTANGLILATGAHDRALPVPGWTLPGVVTAGAAQAMAKGERIASASGWSSPVGTFFPVTDSLQKSGSTVVGVYEAAGIRRLARHWLARPWELRSATSKWLSLPDMSASTCAAGFPTGPAGESSRSTAPTASSQPPWPGSTAVATRRRHRTHRRVRRGVPGTRLHPATGTGHCRGLRSHRDRFVTVDHAQRTSVPSVFAAGEITGIGGVDLALAEGEIAGWVAAGGAPTDSQLAAAVRARAALTRFARRIADAHRIGPGWTGWLEPSTVVCRCEEVDYGTLLAVRRDTESVGLRSLKLTTRAGLGLCQGRICGRSVEYILTRRRRCWLRRRRQHRSQTNRRTHSARGTVPATELRRRRRSVKNDIERKSV